MNQQQLQKLNQLFNQFDYEEKGVSSFALSNLLNRTIAIIDNSKGNKENEKSSNEDIPEIN